MIIGNRSEEPSTQPGLKADPQTLLRLKHIDDRFRKLEQAEDRNCRERNNIGAERERLIEEQENLCADMRKSKEATEVRVSESILRHS